MGKPLSVKAAWLNFYLILAWVIIGTIWAGEFEPLFIVLVAVATGILLFADWVFEKKE